MKTLLITWLCILILSMFGTATAIHRNRYPRLRLVTRGHDVITFLVTVGFIVWIVAVL